MPTKKREYLLRLTLTTEEEQVAKETASALGMSLAAMARVALFAYMREARVAAGLPRK